MFFNKTSRRYDWFSQITAWIAGALNAFGVADQNTPSRLFVAAVKGSAPDKVTDMYSDGAFDKNDLKRMCYDVISNTPKVDFIVNGFTALC